jgi:polyhydroxybutyrate depolymerase
MNKTLVKALLLAIFALLNATTMIAQDVVREEIPVGDQIRSYLIHYPPKYNTNEIYPTLIFFHGSGGSGGQAQSSTGFSATADQYGYIAVYPNGVGGWDENSNNAFLDDMGFARLLIADLIENHNADPARIYLSGFSNGGMMALMAACKLRDQVRAVAVMGSIFTNEMIRPCADAKPISIMIYLGTRDRAFPWEGLGYAYLSAEEVATFWFGLYECKNGRQDDVPTTATSPHTLFVSHLFNCAGNTEVLIYGIEGGAHDPALEVEIMQDDGSVINRGDLFMQFFNRQP